MKFRLDQMHSATGSSRANITVPGCGTRTSEAEDAVLHVDIRNGEIKLYVWADINQENPTHIIDLSKAQLTNREAQDNGTEPEVPATAGPDARAPQQKEQRVRRRRQ